MRWLVVVVAACAGTPPPVAKAPAQPDVVHARIAIDATRWADVVVDGWSALERCNAVVGDELRSHGLERDHVARPCAAAALPAQPAQYQLVAMTEEHLTLTAPNAHYAITTLVGFDSLDACEQGRAQLEAQDAKVFDQEAAARRRATDARIAAVKHECEAARAQGIPHDPSCFCEVVQVPAPVFTPRPRSCRPLR